MSCHFDILLREIPNLIRVIESSKLVETLAELFPCGIVFLALSIIDTKLLSMPKFVDREKRSKF
ncbi:hypothetical protein E0L18_05185 [Pasteurella multocida subsp. multocida]|nr:hypothetical protein E0L18_05185 [Pasteurella multocida subsp. multocida]